MSKNSTDWQPIEHSIRKINQEQNLAFEPTEEELKECNFLWNKSLRCGKKLKSQMSFNRDTFDSRLAQMQSKIEQAETLDAATVIPFKSSRKLSLLMKVAAAILILLAVGFGAYQFGNEYATDYLNSAETLVYSTEAQKNKTIALPDGSTVWLNAGSQITFLSHFDDGRKVSLEGEAFFDVVSNPNKPFTVTTESGTVEVLGTQFNLKSFTDEEVLRLTVIEGKVRFESPNSEQVAIVAEANEQVILKKTSQTLSKVEVAANEAMTWKENQLLLSGITLGEVVGKLNRHHRTNISLEGHNLANLDFSTTSGLDFSDKTLEETLEIITLTLNLQKRTEGEEIILAAKE